MKKIISNTGLVIFGSLVGIVLGELILRVYNPLPSRIKGNSIKLIANYERTVDPGHKDLDASIYYSTNSIGFRGEEPPVNFEDFYTIFTVGGSTTECSLLDDSKTWSYTLSNLLSQDSDSIWLNNAGIDGCSTIGHELLLNEHVYQFNPDMIIFLIGVNEMHIALSKYRDEFLVVGKEYRFRALAQNSKLWLFLWNLYRLNVSKKMNVGHNSEKELPDLPQAEFEEKRTFYQNNQKTYKQRLESIIMGCHQRNITPILVTQPVYKLTAYHTFNFVQFYNQSTIEIGRQYGVPVIDLATRLDDKPEYYYDPVHYTNAGAHKVAQIIYDELKAQSIVPLNRLSE